MNLEWNGLNELRRAYEIMKDYNCKVNEIHCKNCIFGSNHDGCSISTVLIPMENLLEMFK